MKKVLASLIVIATLVACQSPNEKKSENQQNQEQMEQKTLIGKKAILTYPELKAEVHYISENQIHWKTTDPQGNTAEQTNELAYKNIGANQFFLNWIEDDGTTVSQIINLEKGEVTAYLTYNDETGKRVAQLLEGKFELK